MFIHFSLLLETLKVNKFFNFFRHNSIFIITQQNTRSFFNNNNPHNPHRLMWIMWITLCKTFVSSDFLRFFMLITCGKYFDIFFHKLILLDKFVQFDQTLFTCFFQFTDYFSQSKNRIWLQHPQVRSQVLFFPLIFTAQNIIQTSIIYKILLIVIISFKNTGLIPIPFSSSIALTILSSPTYIPTCPSYKTRSPGIISS